MKLICPECKNEVDLSQYPNLSEDQIIECNSCGISLIINSIQNGEVDAEVVDEGK